MDLEEIIKSHVPKLFYKSEQTEFECHFELGKRLHIRDYYYAKEYFQDSEKFKYAVEFLRERLNEVYSDINHTTVICGGCYASQFIHDLSQTLARHNKIINYGIVDHSNDEWSFYLEPKTLLERVVVVLPITCTYATALKIEKLILQFAEERGYDNFCIDRNVFCVFLIADERLKLDAISSIDFGKQDTILDTDADDLYSSFQWKKINRHKIVTFSGDKEDFFGHSLVTLVSKLYLPEKCEKCFPAITLDEEQDLLLKEVCILPTRSNNDTPNLIYGLPRFANSEGKLGPISNLDDRYENPVSNGIFDIDFSDCHLYGHLQYGKNSFLHYIKRAKFYDNNREAILRFFQMETRDFWDRQEMQKSLQLTIVTPKHHKSSSFLADFTNFLESRNINVRLLMVDPFNEYLENLHTEFTEKRPDKIFFFDYVISGAKVFKTILDRINLINGNRGVDRLLFIIDRTTLDSKTEILQTQRTKTDNYLIAFLKLNVPLMNATKSGNPIEEKLAILKDIFYQCHLDGLKLEIGRDISYGAPKSLDELEAFYDKNVQPWEKIRYLIKFKISHLISLHFYQVYGVKKFNKEYTPPFDIVDLKKMISVIQGMKEQLFPTEILRQLSAEEQDMIVDDIIVKTLSRHPFKVYHGVYQTVFKYIIHQMDTVLKGMGPSIDENKRRRFKFYLKRCVEINSNYIISKSFILKLKEIFVKINGDENNSALLNTKYFILKCYKELIHRNPIRSIKLEENINFLPLLPAPILEPGKFTLKDAIQNEFYQLGRIIKSENIHVLNELKSDFLNRVSNKLNNIEPQNRTQEIYHYLSSSPTEAGVFKRFKEFLKYSRLNEQPEQDIKVNIALMLETAFLLSQKNKTRENFLEDVREILEKACQIISTGFVDNDALEYGFFIDYRNKGRGLETPIGVDDIYAQNIYSVISNIKDETQPKIRKDGFIYQMLYGLYNDHKAELDVQTFVALVKGDDGRIFSFKDAYLNKIEPKEKIEPQRIEKDYKNDNKGFDIFTNAKMILLFRLADINLNIDGTHLSDRGEAVFAICLPNAIFKESGKSEVLTLTEFLNVERVRLLLLIKEQLLEYLESLFVNDVFISLRSHNEKVKLKKAMKHGIENYLIAFEYLLDNEVGSFKERHRMCNFLQNTIRRHMTSLLEDKRNTNSFINQKDVPLQQESIRGLFNIVMKLPGIGYVIDNYILQINIPSSIRCNPAIIEQVIPELMVNMKTYAFDCARPLNFKIYYENGYLHFTNPFVPEVDLDPRYIKPGGGKAMCNEVLSDMRLGEIEQIVNDNQLTIKFKVHG